MSGWSWADDSVAAYTTTTGTLSFTDNDITKIFIDWGDGTNQTLKYGINQWTTLENAAQSASFSHIYTNTGTFAPVIRLVNTAGFVSKYFGSASTNIDLNPYESVGSRMPPITVNDGSPTAAIKIENKTVLSGIDNNIFNEGPKDVYMYIPPIANIGMADQIMQITTTVKSLAPSVSGSEELGYAGTLDAITTSFEFGTGVQPVGKINDDKTIISEIVECKMDFVKFPAASGATDLNSNNLNKIKIFLIAQADNGYWYPITYVSNGDPIKKADDNRRLVDVDFTQSRAKAANASCSSFNFDNGKFSWQPYNQWQPSGANHLSGNTNTDNRTERLAYTYYARPDGLLGSGTASQNFTISGSGVAAFVTGNSTIPSADSVMIQDQFLLNDFNQFEDMFHLLRMTTTTDTSQTSTLDTFSGLYRLDPPGTASGTFAYFFNNGEAPQLTYYYATGSYSNALATNTHIPEFQSPILSNFGKFNGVKSGTTGAPTWTNDYKREAPEYLLFTNSNKVNKIFFDNSTYGYKMMSDLVNQSGATVAGVSYLKVYNEIKGDKFTQKAEWVPVKFKDTTRVNKRYRDSSSATYVDKSSSFAKSGYITFDMPNDWETLSLSGMGGGFYDVTGATDSTSSISGSKAHNDYSVYVTGMVQAAISGTGDQFATYPVNDIGYPNRSTWYDDEQIGKYKYMFEVSGGSSPDNIKQIYWIASSSVGYASGTASSSRVLYLTSGNQYRFNAGDSVTGFLRRVNFYEVFGGVSKTSNSGSLPNTDSTTRPDNYTYKFGFGGPGGEIDKYREQWDGDKYALKIVISGAMERTDELVRPGAEMWTALPYNNTYSQIVQQKDNTAYDLSYMPINSDVSVNYAGTFFQAISKNGRVFIVRTGTPIQTIGLNSKAMGTEESFSYSDDFTTFDTLEKIRDAQANAIRVMWDEKQKDGTWVRFFGVITSVAETHSVSGPRAPRNFNASLMVEEICLINQEGILISDLVPLGGVADASTFF